jgi:hypothetical protein
MPKAFFDHDPITLQEGTHTSAKIGNSMIQPDTAENVTGEFDHITIYHTPNSPVKLKCTHDVQFSPGEQVILQQLGEHPRMGTNEQLLTGTTDPVSYAVIGMESGKEVEFKE